MLSAAKSTVRTTIWQGLDIDEEARERERERVLSTLLEYERNELAYQYDLF
jgi:hypothetical protein